jgi:membrane protease YdiL (CAAX protease family)
MGFRGPHRLPRVAWGAAIGFLLLALLLLLSWALGGRELRGSPHSVPAALHVGRALFAAAAVSLFEEILCRGYLKDAIGGTLGALLYAGAHYLRPPQGSAPAAGYDPLLGVTRLPELLSGWTEPRPILLGFTGLFLLGLALNRLRERTGTLYAGMGLHAALVFGVELYRRVFHVEPAGDPWVFGGNRLHDGFLGLLGMAAVLVVSHRAPLPDRLRP